jgi:molybdopterin synthase sulfur carrier subunit
MSIKVLLFASLREEFGMSELTVEPEEAATVAEIWQRLCQDRDTSTRVLHSVNMEYAEPESPVQDGDEVAFFPPVTGGER